MGTCIAKAEIQPYGGRPGKFSEPQQIPLLEVIILGVSKFPHGAVFAHSAVELLSLEPGPVPGCHVFSHDLTGDDVVNGAFGFST